MAGTAITNPQLLAGPGVVNIFPSTQWTLGSAFDGLTPIRVGVLQSVMLDYALKPTELYGARVNPVNIMASTGKLTGKCKLASWSAYTYNAILFGNTSLVATGMGVVLDEPHVIPASTPFTVIITTTAAGIDMGVFYASAVSGGVQQQFTAVASGPTVGQYSLVIAPTTMTYTFAAADAGKSIFISYQTPTVGYSTWNFPNPFSGPPPNFQVCMTMPYQGKTALFTIPNCSINKLAIPTKINGWVETEFDFQAFTLTEPGNLMTMSVLT